MAQGHGAAARTADDDRRPAGCFGAAERRAEPETAIAGVLLALVPGLDSDGFPQSEDRGEW